MGTTPPITTNNPQNTRSTKPDQTTCAGEKWVSFVHFSVAVVLSVATVAVQGRAVVMVVSLGDRELTGSGSAVPRPMMAAVAHAVMS